jgi:hypothetical protein
VVRGHEDGMSDGHDRLLVPPVPDPAIARGDSPSARSSSFPDPRETLTARRHSTTCVGARAYRRTTRPPCRVSRQHSPEVANADRSPVRGRERR